MSDVVGPVEEKVIPVLTEALEVTMITGYVLIVEALDAEGDSVIFHVCPRSQAIWKTLGLIDMTHTSARGQVE